MTQPGIRTPNWTAQSDLLRTIGVASSNLQAEVRALADKSRRIPVLLGLMLAIVLGVIAWPPSDHSPEAFRRSWNSASTSSDWAPPFYENNGPEDLWSDLPDGTLMLGVNSHGRVTSFTISNKSRDPQVLGTRCVALIQSALGWPRDRAKVAAGSALDAAADDARNHPDNISNTGYYRTGGIEIAMTLSIQDPTDEECVVRIGG